MDEYPALPIVEIANVPFEISQIKASLGHSLAMAADTVTLEHSPNALMVRGCDYARRAQDERGHHQEASVFAADLGDADHPLRPTVRIRCKASWSLRAVSRLSA